MVRVPAASPARRPTAPFCAPPAPVPVLRLDFAPGRRPCPGGLCGLHTTPRTVQGSPSPLEGPRPGRAGREPRVWARVSGQSSLPSSRSRRRVPSGPPGRGVPVRGPPCGCAAPVGAPVPTPPSLVAPLPPLVPGRVGVTLQLPMVRLGAFPGVHVLQGLPATALPEAQGVQNPASAARSGRF